jgi:hypothetical protein
MSVPDAGLERVGISMVLMQIRQPVALMALKV